MNQNKFHTPEEEIQTYLFNIKSLGRNKLSKEETSRVEELLSELVARGHSTFSDIFDEVWKLRIPNRNNRRGSSQTEEYARLRVYEYLQRACLRGLIHKEGKLYSVQKGVEV